MESATYEEQFSPVARRWQRLLRAARWQFKGVLGMRRTILVEIRWRLGDEIMALPIYGALQQRYPKATVHVLCSYPDLLPAGVADAERAAIHPDRYVLLRNAARNVNRLEHYARRARVPVPMSRPAVSVPDARADDWTAAPGKRVVIAPGATWLAKHWLRERWKELSEQLTASGAEVVVLGNAGEGLDAGLDLTGQTSVMDCARIIAGADVCVCSDSGLMHLSLAVGTPVVALFGPTNPAILVRHDERLHAVTNERECRFCWNDSQEMVEPGVCPRQIVHCLGTIGVESVASEVRNALNGRR